MWRTICCALSWAARYVLRAMPWGAVKEYSSGGFFSHGHLTGGFLPCSYWGELLHEQRFGMLLEATWLAAPEGAFPDQPPKPRSASGSSQPAANGTAGRPAKPFQAAAGYVPPHVRGASGSPVFRSLIFTRVLHLACGSTNPWLAPVCVKPAEVICRPSLFVLTRSGTSTRFQRLNGISCAWLAYV